MKTLRFLVLALLTMLGVLQSHRGLSQQPTTPMAEAITPQIQALADGLQDNPEEIFNYVHDHIRFVLYFGSTKGANLTLLEKSGNDFDQSALLVALLSAAGYSNNVSYKFGWQEIPYDDPPNDYDLHHWWQLTLDNTNWDYTIDYFATLAGNRGYPDSYYVEDGYNNNFVLQRVWVQLTIGSTAYQLDPAFKVSQPVATLAGFSLTNAMGASGASISNALLSAAGGTDSGNFVQNLTESAVRSKLTTYTSNLVSFIQNNSPNASVQSILGGWQIVPAYDPWDFSTSTTFTQASPYGMSVQGWTYEPTNLMCTLAINFAGTNYQWNLPQLQGQRVSLTFSNNGVAKLWQEDNLLAQKATGGSGSTTNVILTITHPFGTWNTIGNTLINNPTNFANASTTNSYQCTNATYNIMYAFDPDWGWLQQRQNKLDTYLQEGYTNGTRQVTSETLNIMALTWFLQTAQMEQILAGQLGVLTQHFHRVGRMAQETGRGYYVDAYMQLSGEFPSGGEDVPHVQSLVTDVDLWSFFGSAMEHGLIEELQNTNVVGASTVKMLQLANTNGQPVYLASSTNWTTGYNVHNHLTSGTYDAGTIAAIGNYISQGYYVLLPQNGSNHVSGPSSSWAGYGFEARLGTAAGVTTEMIISGGYHGGFSSSSTATVDPAYTDQTADSQPDFFQGAPLSTPAPTSADPVDTADDTFQVEHTDLSLGQADPRGMTLSRYYNGTRRFTNPAGMAGGWIHNYCATANNVPAPEACLGGTTPAQAAAMLTASAAAIATYNGGYPDPKNWLTTVLISKWAVDQITKSGVSISIGKDTLQFVQQPDGVFTPPGNCTASLTQSNSAYHLLLRHGNQFNFGSAGLLTNITDQYDQTLHLTYNSSNWVSTITDWKGRILTFNYTNGQLDAVSDNSTPARTVRYGYSAGNPQGDLTSFTDTENKTTTYGYDTDHQITATVDALNRLVVSNVYDRQGHIVVQYSQGSTNMAWRLYWSGWQTIEQDPAGGVQIYLYDNQNRLIAQVDALGHTNQMVYDGQNHVVTTISPMGETNQFIFDGNNNSTNSIDALGDTNQYFFDLQNDLVRTVDPLGHSNTFGYNVQFSLTGQTNGAGDWVNYAFNTDGTPHTKTDSGGTTTYGNDSFGQLNSIIYPNGLGSESFVNSSLGDVTNHTDARGFATSFQFNNRREQTNSTGPTNLTVSVAFDAIGNVALTTDARANVTSNSWSATRQLLATTLPPTPQGTPIITNGYDVRDWPTSIADPLRNSTVFSNDLAGRLISQTDPLQRTNRFTFDPDGRKLTSANGANETNSQTWDARSKLLSQTDAAGRSVIYSNDAAGNQVILTNRNGKIWQFFLDGANRLTFTISPLARSNSVVFSHQGLPILLTDPAGQNTTNTFDARGRLLTRGDKVGITTNAYDGNNNLTNVFENGNTNVWTFDAYNRVSSYRDIYGNLIQYRCDANGNVTNLIYPGNRTVNYYFDNLNHLTNATDWAGRSTSFTYDLAGHLTGITRPNGTYRTISYDPAGQVTNIWEQMANGLPIAWFRLNWANNGDMAWEFAAPLPHTNTPPVRTMTYDADNRLATFNGLNVYPDLDGNLTNGPLLTNSFVTYNYDARNRLLSAGGVTNAYDTINNRIGQVFGTTNTIFVVNPNAKLPQVLMRIKNGITNYYIYGAGLLYQVTEAATGTNTLTYHYDYRGSTIALTGDNGVPTDRMEYSLYGLTTYRTGTNDTPFLFNGRYGVQTDPNGLLYMRSRYYNPYLCRFINPDPSGFKGGLNFYAYANGNPVSYLDPYGLNAASTGDSTWDWFDNKVTSLFDGGVPDPGQIASAMVDNAVASFLPTTDTDFQHPMASQFNAYNPNGNASQWADLTTLSAAAFLTPEALDSSDPLAGQSMAADGSDLTVVSRWGSTGLQSGNWVMNGPPSILNYILSFKWQPGAGNQFAPFNSGRIFTVPAFSVSWPSGWGIDGAWKGLFGQRIYTPTQN